FRDGQPVREFRTLAGAIAELQKGDAVEVHGNGPFRIGRVKIEGQGLTLRAAPGYRPRLEMAESVGPPQGGAVWFTVRGGGLTIDGCDLVGTTAAHFFHHAGGPLHLRRCRLLQCYSIGTYEQGPEVRLEECFIHCYYGLGVQAPKAVVEVTNN